MTWVTTNAMNTGKIAWTDSLTPRMLRTVKKPIETISIPSFVRCTGSHQVPSSSGVSRSACGPNHARGIMLKIASPPDAIDVVIVST